MALPVSAWGDDTHILPEGHPNHFIVLVDGTFGITKGEKNYAYRNLLETQLPEMLYGSGLNRLPPLDAARDFLTIMQFGIVSEKYPAEVAYRHLSEFRFTRDFIRQVVARKKGVGPDEFRKYAVPQSYHRLTFQVWARELALAALAGGSAEPANRTFLILVTDGEPNGDSTGPGVRAESHIANSWGNKEDVKTATALVKTIQDEYALTDGAGGDGFAFDREYSVGGSKSTVVFLQAHEVVPKAWQKWAAQAPPLSPLSAVSSTIVTGSDGARARFQARLSPPASDWIGQLAPSAVEWNWSAGQGTTAPCENGRFLPLLAGPVNRSSCAPVDQTLHATARVVHSDPLLGTRAAQIQFSQIVPGPTPWKCALWFSLTVAGAVALAAAAAWFLVERFLRSDLRVSIPILITQIPLGRGTRGDATCLSVPRLGEVAFSVILPPRWRQQLFYRGALLTIGGPDGAAVAWRIGGGPSLRLPIMAESPGCREAVAVWQSEPDHPADIGLQLVDGLRSCELHVRFAYRPKSLEAYGS
jgi:hypothetical protein